MQRQPDVMEHTAPRQTVDAQQLAGRERPCRRVRSREVAIDHQADELRRASRRRARASTTFRPSRRTVTRSPIADDLVQPVRDVDDGDAGSLQPRMIAKSCSTSASVSADVGSSMTRTRASSASAFAISTICCCATPRRARDRRSSMSGRARASRPSALGRACGASRRARQRRRLAAEEDVLGDGQVGNELELLVDDADAQPPGVGGRRNRDGPAVEPDLAGVRPIAPLRIFMSVDLPAPFSPSSTCTSPACNSSATSSSATTPGNCLQMPRICRISVESIDGDVNGRAASGRSCPQRWHASAPLYRDLQLSAFSFQLPDPGSRIPDPDRIPSWLPPNTPGRSKTRRRSCARCSDRAPPTRGGPRAPQPRRVVPPAGGARCRLLSAHDRRGRRDSRGSARRCQAAGHPVRRGHLARRARQRHPAAASRSTCAR